MAIATIELTGADRRAVRRLLDASCTSFSDHDWEHGLGGLHALVRDGDRVVAHASPVQRRLLVGEAGGRWLRCGYVEAVAVAVDRRRRGLGGEVMAELEAHADSHDVLALCASATAVDFYLARGWLPWRGPSSVLAPAGLTATPDEDGAIFVWGTSGVDLDAPIVCDWREGDVW